MKTACLLLTAALCPLVFAAPSAPVNEQPAFLPAPLELELLRGQAGYALSQGIKLGESLLHRPEGQRLATALEAAGVAVKVVPGAGDIALTMAAGSNPEHYELAISPEGLTVLAHGLEALPLVAQTLAQATVPDADGAPALPSLRLRDEPLFPYRGLMLDCGRFPQTKDELRKILRVMARYKLNRLHWHLTEDQGWRLEIKAYPRLTEVGARRPSSAIWPDNAHQDGVPVEMFYSQEDVREMVDYAHRLGIIIIPEIEIPGHASAAIAAYPELGNDDAPGFLPEVATTWGVKSTVLAPREATWRFISAVLAEVCELFPLAPCIHCGGDEVPRRQWAESPTTRAFMAAHGMESPAEVQHYFTQFCAAELAKHGRRMVGWDEIQEAPALPENALVMVWHGQRYEQAVRQAVQGGHEVIATPNSHLYLNFGHEVWAKDPFYRAYVGSYKEQNRDWQQLYSFNPIPEGLEAGQQRRIIGVQGNAWGEVIPDARKLEYMVFPRLLALAEVAWLPASRRNAGEFRTRLLAQYPYLDSEGINFREEDGTPRRDRDE